MSGFHFNDDVFSPIRFDTSAVDSSKNSDEILSDISDSNIRLSLTGTQQNEYALEKNVTKHKRQNELQPISRDQNAIDIKSRNTFTPALDRKSSEILNAKQLDTEKVFKDKNVKKENHLKNVEYLKEKPKKGVNALAGKASKLDSAQKSTKRKTLRQSPVRSAECNAKDIRVAEKNTTHSLKNIYSVENKNASKSKQSFEKDSVDNTLDLKKNSVLKYKNASEKSIELNERNTIFDSVKQKSSAFSQNVDSSEPIVNLPLSQYEASIEKIVHDCVSYECAKIRQNCYMQQMAFYRQINNIKSKMEQEHVAVRERLLKVIEELMQINATLKSSVNIKD